MEFSGVELPRWNMSQTCFQMYGTKRKKTFSAQDEPQDNFCPVSKRVCLPSYDASAMDEDCLPETPFPAITHQPTMHLVSKMAASSPSHQIQRQEQFGHSREEKKQNTWFSWQNGQVGSWRDAISSCTDKSGLVENGRDVPFMSGGGDGVGFGGEESRLLMSPSSPRVEIDELGGSDDWQTPENLRRQLEKQVHTPDLHQTRQDTLRAKADKLRGQLQYMKSMQVESNDYWALPQENQLKMEDELEQARIAMEDDYVPDPYQYHCSDVQFPMPSHDSGSVNQVRCYCKPNWEGMMDPVGYI